MPNDEDDGWHTELQLSTSSPVAYENNSESQRLLAEEDSNEMPHVEQDDRYAPAARMFFIRALALLCACSLSIGSH
jgi:hypothetical protein